MYSEEEEQPVVIETDCGLLIARLGARVRWGGVNTLAYARTHVAF